VRYRNLLVLPLIAWLYAPVLARLFAVWMYDPFFSHGIFVPAFAALVLWRDRKKLKAIEAAPSWAGLPLVGLALLIRYSTVLKGGLFFSGVSLLLLLAGFVILVYGWEFFRAVLFPWAFLILMIPVPSVILQKVTFSLQVPTLKLSAFLLQLAGVPLVRVGNVIMLHANSTLFSFEAESGVRSLLTPLTAAIIHGYLADNRKWVRAVLACSSVPIAIVADSFRIVGICLLGQFWGLDEVKLFSPYSGWLIFAVSLIMLFILHRLILRVWGGNPEAKYSMQLPAATTSTLVSRGF
jgi:exosortase